VFFSCPHLGSELADLKMPTEKLFWPSLEVQELRYSELYIAITHLVYALALLHVYISCPSTFLLLWIGSAALVDLHLRFLQLLEVSRMSLLSFAETKATNVTAMRLPINFVQPHSAG